MYLVCQNRRLPSSNSCNPNASLLESHRPQCLNLSRISKLRLSSLTNNLKMTYLLRGKWCYFSTIKAWMMRLQKALTQIFCCKMLDRFSKVTKSCLSSRNWCISSKTCTKILFNTFRCRYSPHRTMRHLWNRKRYFHRELHPPNQKALLRLRTLEVTWVSLGRLKEWPRKH
jgi:hypothetical protein